jgi:hypothetical protein
LEANCGGGIRYAGGSVCKKFCLIASGLQAYLVSGFVEPGVA